MRTTSSLRSAIAALRPAFEETFAALVEAPSVSMEPERKPDILRCAQIAEAALRTAGAEVIRVETNGYPLVVGRIIRDRAWPTLTIYNHLDVQPALASEWRTAPFTFTRHGDRYFARGTTDDKGPALAALYGAQLAVQDHARVNVQFLWEFEEEIGSPHFEQGLTKLMSDGSFTTDSIVVSDTIWIAAGRPAIPYGLRGLASFTVRLQTGAKDVHSGTTGGAARNPVGELADVIAACYDARSGRVKIPGFYREVRKVSPALKASLARAGFSRRRFAAAHELRSLRFASDARLMEAIMAAPTFEVHGLVGGYTGPGVKTIVPHAAEAKLSMRLVPDQDPRAVFALCKAFIKKRCPDAVVTAEGFLDPYLGKPAGPFHAAAAQAVKATFGRSPAFTREGGSIGAVLTMQKRLNAPMVFLGLSLPEHGYHAINENFDWGQAGGGIELFYRYLHAVQDIPRNLPKLRKRTAMTTLEPAASVRSKPRAPLVARLKRKSSIKA